VIVFDSLSLLNPELQREPTQEARASVEGSLLRVTGVIKHANCRFDGAMLRISLLGSFDSEVVRHLSHYACVSTDPQSNS
jgi:hypothetical protein